VDTFLTFFDFLIKNGTPSKQYVPACSEVMSHKIICSFVPKKSITNSPQKGCHWGILSKKSCTLWVGEFTVFPKKILFLIFLKPNVKI
jgi:hypothetical protein